MSIPCVFVCTKQIYNSQVGNIQRLELIDGVKSILLKQKEKSEKGKRNPVVGCQILLPSTISCCQTLLTSGSVCVSVMNWAISNLTGGNRVSRAILVRYSSVPLAEDGTSTAPQTPAATTPRSSTSHTSLSSSFAATFLHSSSRHNHNNNHSSTASSSNNNNVGTGSVATAGGAASGGSNASPSLSLPLDVEETVTCFCR